MPVQRTDNQNQNPWLMSDVQILVPAKLAVRVGAGCCRSTDADGSAFANEENVGCDQGGEEGEQCLVSVPPVMITAARFFLGCMTMTLMLKTKGSFCFPIVDLPTLDRLEVENKGECTLMAPPSPSQLSLPVHLCPACPRAHRHQSSFNCKPTSVSSQVPTPIPPSRSALRRKVCPPRVISGPPRKGPGQGCNSG